MIKLWKKTKIGNQIMVGFMAKTKTESANKNPAFLLDLKTSLRMINEKTITGKSADGDWENRNKTGRKIK